MPDPPPRNEDPYLTHRFSVEITGLKEVAAFSEVSGLDFESEVQTFREGGVHLYEEQLAGQTKFPGRLVLKRGLVDGQVGEELWNWHQGVTEGRVDRRNISIVLHDSKGDEKRRWTFREAAPVKWVGPQFRAMASEIAIESLELVHRGYLKQK